jgi:hypothetical protein
MSRRLSKSGGPDLDIEHYLDSIRRRLAHYEVNVSADKAIGVSLAQVESMVSGLEDAADG